MTAMTATRQVMRDAVASRVTPGAAVAIVRPSGEMLRLTEGYLTYEANAAAVDDETIYDLASLTKVLVTTTLLADLVTHHRLDLDAPIHGILPIWRRGPLSRVTLRHLLTHSAGLPAHLPLYRTCTGRAAYLDALDRVKPIAEVASVSVYSDLGFIALGLLLEMVTGRPLREAYAAWLHASDLGHLPLTYVPVERDRRRVAPTEWDPWRQRLLLAEVHDENAWALGGDAGHAGLFGTAAAVGCVARWWMQRVHEQDEWRLWTSPCLIPGSSRALGWDTMRPTSSCGPLFSSSAFGHTGFTGTSLWIDPVRQTGVVLLSNRVHPSRHGDRMQPVRRRLHTAVAHDLRWS
jgi:CubicO group peptidase (beta-lactamase class C family)